MYTSISLSPTHVPQDRAISDRKGGMNFPLWLFLLLVLLSTEEGAGEKDDEKRRLRKHCPVSHILDPHINGYFSYPVNIWGPDFLSGVMFSVGIKLVDFKIEIGRFFEGEYQRLLIADEISPDSCRLWDVKSGKKLDKDVFRRDLGSLTDAYTEVANRLGLLPKTNSQMKPILVK